ncbi:acetoacetate decarboxylase family protein [Acinetobacter bereziniae]|uniref:acetoacetate decarboxylase family protein n=1 Tax=Acinetobacter bereziniae TaxID=106648 RepID=UPI000C2B5FF7|nr:acetoacetate decarboxylase family protein [Acinetobacter bereziniae]ATZ64454.1 acetoacetate decarboxylase [Acinetobacter bereziniae]
MNTDKQFTEVEFGQYKVKVPSGGYYDRFRMNPDLDQVAQDTTVGNIDFFRKIPKKQIASRVGLVWAPNFYYKSSNVQLLMLAPIRQLRNKLPQPLEPLQALPGYGLVALTFFHYDVCDNDPYNEVSVAIVVRQPQAKGSHALELFRSMRQHHFYAHVVALPVDTEIARIRGVHGYQLPKWLTEIHVNINTSTIHAHLKDTIGQPDLSLTTTTPKLKKLKPESRISKTTMLHQVDHQWQQTQVLTNTLSFTQKLLPKHVKLIRHGGPLSQLLNELDASTILRLDVVEDAQVVLHLPVPVKIKSSSN